VNEPAPVSVRTRFERFPATVKGAFVIRGEDSDPHQVVVRAGHVVRLPASPARPLPLNSVTVDVPPHRDVFVPFELATSDLDPGWYAFEIELDVDGSPRRMAGDRRFAIAWPRGSVRTGTVKVERAAKLGKSKVTVDRLQLAVDATTIRFSVDPPEPVAVRLDAGRSKVDVLAVEVDQQTGDATAIAYPLRRSDRTLRIEFQQGRGRSGAGRADLTVQLP
jgi:hypothetical protein